MSKFQRKLFHKICEAFFIERRILNIQGEIADIEVVRTEKTAVPKFTFVELYALYMKKKKKEKRRKKRKEKKLGAKKLISRRRVIKPQNKSQANEVNCHTEKVEDPVAPAVRPSRIFEGKTDALKQASDYEIAKKRIFEGSAAGKR